MKTGRVVREVAAAVMIEKYRINLTFLLLFAPFLFSFFIFALFCNSEGYCTIIIDWNEGINSIPRCDAIVLSVVAAATTTHAFEQQHMVRTAPLVRRDEGYRTWSGNRIDTAVWYTISLRLPDAAAAAAATTTKTSHKHRQRRGYGGSNNNKLARTRSHLYEHNTNTLVRRRA